MDRATYSAASAGILHLTKLEVVNNNLANLSTPGFKGQYLVTQQGEFENTLASALDSSDPYAKGDFDRTPNVESISTATDFSLGPIEQTGDPLNAALRDGSEFFVVNTPQGQLYTRAGNFSLDTEGRLVTASGNPVQGDGGEIIIEGGTAEITSGGFVRVNGESVGRLQVVRFEDPAGLERVGANSFKVNGNAQPVQADEPSVIPGALEKANVSAVQAIVELIAASRGFELYTKSAQSIDQMNQSAIQKLGGRGV